MSQITHVREGVQKELETFITLTAKNTKPMHDDLWSMFNFILEAQLSNAEGIATEEGIFYYTSYRKMIVTKNIFPYDSYLQLCSVESKENKLRQESIHDKLRRHLKSFETKGLVEYKLLPREGSKIKYPHYRINPLLFNLITRINNNESLTREDQRIKDELRLKDKITTTTIVPAARKEVTEDRLFEIFEGMKEKGDIIAKINAAQRVVATLFSEYIPGNLFDTHKNDIANYIIQNISSPKGGVTRPSIDNQLNPIINNSPKGGTIHSPKGNTEEIKQTTTIEDTSPKGTSEIRPRVVRVPIINNSPKGTSEIKEATIIEEKNQIITEESKGEEIVEERIIPDVNVEELMDICSEGDRLITRDAISMFVMGYNFTSATKAAKLEHFYKICKNYEQGVIEKGYKNLSLHLRTQHLPTTTLNAIEDCVKKAEEEHGN